MKEYEAFWAMLPPGLEPFFELKSIERDEHKFRIVLVEKNILPNVIKPPILYRNVIVKIKYFSMF